jgi:polyisoprenyl-phosphate glycosyltransferase
MKLSVIIPVYNGAKTIGPLVQAVEKELASEFDLEVVLVNDGSPADNSAEVCLDIARRNPKVKFIDLSRNFSEHNAVMAGLNYCTGEAALIMDDDFQNPVSEVIKLVKKLNDGYDVVYSRYKKKEHHFLRNLGSNLNSLMASVLVGKPVDLYLSSFKAVNRFVINEVIKYTGPYPYVDGLILRVTRNYCSVLVEHNPTFKDKSGYTVRKLVSLWLKMFTGFSVLPLRIATILGFVFAFIGLVGGTVFFIEKIDNPDLPSGWASLIVSLFIISGVQLFAIGMIGEYLGRMFLKDTGNPQFAVRRTVNCQKEKEAC